jgi:hypothetical protein
MHAWAADGQLLWCSDLYVQDLSAQDVDKTKDAVLLPPLRNSEMLLYGAMVGDGWAAESHMGGLAPSVSLAISCTCEEMLKFYEEAFNRLIKTGVSAQAWAGKSGAFIRRCTKVTPSGEVINRLPQVMVRGCSSLCMHVLCLRVPRACCGAGDELRQVPRCAARHGG